MAISLDLHLLVHAISNLETCQLRVPPVSVAHEIPGFVADDLSVFLEEFKPGDGMLLGILQEVHHDIWDYDAASPVVLFDHSD